MPGAAQKLLEPRQRELGIRIVELLEFEVHVVPQLL